MNTLKKSRGFTDGAIRNLVLALQSTQEGRFDDMKFYLDWANRCADEGLMIYISELEVALRFVTRKAQKKVFEAL